MTIRIFVNIYCFKMVCSPLPLPHPSAQPEVPYTLPETKLPKPRGQKGHTFASPLPSPCCFSEPWYAKYFALMSSASLTGSYRCLSQPPRDNWESESMWLQQGKYDSITASCRDLLADCPRDLGHPLGWLSVRLIKQLEAFQEKQVPNSISLSFLPFVMTWESSSKRCLDSCSSFSTYHLCDPR